MKKAKQRYIYCKYVMGQKWYSGGVEVSTTGTGASRPCEVHQGSFSNIFPGAPKFREGHEFRINVTDVKYSQRRKKK